MREIISHFCADRNNGLCLINMPTGYGKTYSVFKFILENYNKPEFKNRKFFFVTTLKKNLQFDKMRKMFSDIGAEKEFDSIAIQLKPNCEEVIEKWEEAEKEIPSDIKNTEEYRNISCNIYNLKNTDNTPQKEFKEMLKKEISEKNEPEFRRLIIRYLDEIPSVNEKLKCIENDKRYRWISILYPAVFSKFKRIFFMSIDKFVCGNNTLVEPLYRFYNSSFINNSVIFIDEFDADKQSILNQIINSSLNRKINYIFLFNQLYSTLETRDFPVELLTCSEKTMAAIKKYPKIKKPHEIIKIFREKFRDVYEKYNIKYSFKTEVESNNRNFIFNDFIYHFVLNSKKYIELECNESRHQNMIKFTDEYPAEKEKQLHTMLKEIKYCINYFIRGCRYLAQNYYEVIRERQNSADDDYTIENAVQSILSEFHFSTVDMEFLKDSILMEELYEGVKEVNTFYGNSVYESGFSYYDFINTPNHSTQSEIRMFKFPYAPEYILLQMCRKACVVGISATATLENVIGNFDLNYLRDTLGEDFYEIPPEEKERLKSEYSNFILPYKDVGIKVNSVEDIKTEDLFSDSAKVKMYEEKLSFFKDFERNPLLKVIWVLRDFICNDEMQSFLCMNNVLAKENEGRMNLRLIKEFTDDLCKQYNKPFNAEELIETISGNNFDIKKQSIIKRLSQGKKLFVLSSYGTIGVGQNLQYPIEKSDEYIYVNDRNIDEKDFDGIYVEKPSNLLVNVKENIDDINFIKAIYQMEFLMENFEISQNIGHENIENYFRIRDGGRGSNKNTKAIYNTESVNNYAVRTIAQAIGRICRTGVKKKNIYIYVDSGIFEKYDFGCMEDNILNPEFRKITEFSRTYYDKDKSVRNSQNYEIKAGNISLKSMNIISGLMNDFNDTNIRLWNKLRQQMLIDPTLSDKQIEDIRFGGFCYFNSPEKINEYSYTQKNDYYSDITVKFNMNLSQKVSEKEARLQELLEIPGMRDYFIKNNYAVSFEKNNFILTPPMFNNIYKGALGEETGKFIFENMLNIHLKEIDNPQHFELFDFMINDDIYVDFKYMKDTTYIDAQKEKEKIISKLDQCGGKKALIIAIMADREYKVTISNDGRIVEIPYLYRTDIKQIDTKMCNVIYKELR